MPAAYPLLGLVFGVAPRLLAGVRVRTLAAVAVVTLAVGVTGITLNLRAYPLTDAVVVIFCLTAGTVMGRVVPPHRRPMAIVLAILAALDTVQVFAAGSGNTTPSALRAWTMFLLVTPVGATAIGFADLAVIAAVGEHWRRRGENAVWSMVPGFLALSLADLFNVLVYRGGLPLLPFVLAGWVISEVGVLAWNRANGK
jgi:hypothetical protein